MGSEKLSVHCSMIVYHVHQIERRGGAVRGHVLKQQGFRAREGMEGERGKMGMEVGRLGASVRRGESWEKCNGGPTATTKGTVSPCCSTGSLLNHNDPKVLCEYRKLKKHGKKPFQPILALQGSSYNQDL